MSILEQDQIDKLQLELANLENMKQLASRAREKIYAMHSSVLTYACLSELETLEEIGEVISRIGTKITRQSVYYESFNLLKKSYQSRISG